MSIRKSFIGERSGGLVVIGDILPTPRGKNRRVVVRCDCGIKKEIFRSSLGRIKSCGCFKYRRKNIPKRIKNTYYSMISRCHNPRDTAYKDYGGRGIEVCNYWKGENGMENFYENMGDKPKDMTLERINNSEGYSKTNCKWGNWFNQHRNKRNNVFIEYNGVKLCVVDWAKKIKMSRQVIHYRLKLGWEPKDIINTKLNYRRHKIF